MGNTEASQKKYESEKHMLSKLSLQDRRDLFKASVADEYHKRRKSCIECGKDRLHMEVPNPFHFQFTVEEMYEIIKPNADKIVQSGGRNYNLQAIDSEARVDYFFYEAMIFIVLPSDV